MSFIAFFSFVFLSFHIWPYFLPPVWLHILLISLLILSTLVYPRDVTTKDCRGDGSGYSLIPQWTLCLFFSESTQTLKHSEWKMKNMNFVCFWFFCFCFVFCIMWNFLLFLNFFPLLSKILKDTNIYNYYDCYNYYYYSYPTVIEQKSSVFDVYWVPEFTWDLLECHWLRQTPPLHIFDQSAAISHRISLCNEFRVTNRVVIQYIQSLDACVRARPCDYIYINSFSTRNSQCHEDSHTYAKWVSDPKSLSLFSLRAPSLTCWRLSLM